MLEKSLNSILSNFLRDYGVDSNLGLSKITLSTLKGGESSASLYQFDVNESRFVLRIPPASASLLTRARQAFLAKQAGEMGIGPKVCYIDPQFNGKQPVIYRL